MEIQNVLDIPTIYQRLYFQGKELDDNAANVVMLGVMSNDTLYLKEEPEDVDMLDTDTEDPLPKSKSDEGRGFGGTLLSSTASIGKVEVKTKPLVRSCSACTFENLPDAGVCEICDTRL
ncbi:hypothetical protein QCA50_003025 [Cerrena zonata]|uniref:Ubiquitin-like domain-containing protein n=1 Tax=Cerrena zonata TaxID=2478898 RepID=A0AAW0GLD8_9APHY